jgi:hypothetical protein
LQNEPEPEAGQAADHELISGGATQADEQAWAAAWVSGSSQKAQAVGSSQEAQAVGGSQEAQARGSSQEVQAVLSSGERIWAQWAMGKGVSEESEFFNSSEEEDLAEKHGKMYTAAVAAARLPRVDAVTQLQSLVRELYSAVDPEKLPQARKIAEHYLESQDQLNERLRLRYGTDLKAYKSFGQRAIPDILHFNHYKNFFEEYVPGLEGIKANVEKIMALHPGTTMSFSTDIQCRAALASGHSEKLAVHFDNERAGCYKSDLCRLARLYELGGYYFDNDFEAVTDVRRLIPAGASISTVMAMTDRGVPSIGLDGRLDVFQAFLAVAPRHPVLYNALDFTFQWYERGENLDEHNGERQMWYNHPRRDGPCEVIDPERCHQVLAGPTFVGKALRNWLDVQFLHVGQMDQGKGCQWKGDHNNSNKCAYLFTEEDDIKQDPYNLPERNAESGWPRCAAEPYHAWCNIAVVDGRNQYGWSRSPDAAEFEGYSDASLSLKQNIDKLRLSYRTKHYLAKSKSKS